MAINKPFVEKKKKTYIPLKQNIYHLYLKPVHRNASYQIFMDFPIEN